MGKKKYSKNQVFYCTFAINTRKEIYGRFTLEKIESTRLGLLYDIIASSEELSDGEIALGLSSQLEKIYGDGLEHTQITLINWWAI